MEIGLTIPFHQIRTIRIQMEIRNWIYYWEEQNANLNINNGLNKWISVSIKRNLDIWNVHI